MCTVYVHCAYAWCLQKLCMQKCVCLVSPEIGITTVVSCYVGTEKLCKNRKCS